jgi:hypothetical protein
VEEADEDVAREENQGAGGDAVESGTPVAGDHQPVVTPNTRVVLEIGRHAAEKWGEDSPRAEINVEGGVEENAMGQATWGYCHTKQDRPESVTRFAAQPAIVVEEFNDLRSSDDENTATSAPPAQSSAASGRNNSPSLPSRPAGLGSSSSLLPPARPIQQARANGPVSSERGSQPSTESAEDDGDENDEVHEKLQMIRVKFLSSCSQVWANTS